MADQQRHERDESNELDNDDEEQQQDPETVDPDVKDIFEQAQELDYGREELTRKLEAYTDRTPELTGGDVDASWEYADVGEETVGGQNPTPDQSVVEEEGEAVGLTYQDNEPLAVEDKVGKRDRDPWELNPASTPDYPERVQQEFREPLETLGIASETGEQAKSSKRHNKSETSRARPSRQSRPRKSTPGAAGMRAAAVRRKSKTAKGRSSGVRTAKGSQSRKTQRTKAGSQTRSRRSASTRARDVRH